MFVLNTTAILSLKVIFLLKAFNAITNCVGEKKTNQGGNYSQEYFKIISSYFRGLHCAMITAVQTEKKSAQNLGGEKLVCSAIGNT